MQYQIYRNILLKLKKIENFFNNDVVGMGTKLKDFKSEKMQKLDK